MTLKLSNEKAIYFEWFKAALIYMYWSINDKIYEYGFCHS